MSDTIPQVQTIDYLEISCVRRFKDLELYVKVSPRVEDFIASLCDSNKFDPLEALARNWVSANAGNKIQVYRFVKELPLALGQHLLSVGGSLYNRNGAVNLSFLQFVGLSKPEGITFCIEGPIDKASIQKLNSDIIAAMEGIIKGFIAPVRTVIKIYSQELTV